MHWKGWICDEQMSEVTNSKAGRYVPEGSCNMMSDADEMMDGTRGGGPTTSLN